MTLDQWLEQYNAHVDKPLKAFKSRADALDRLAALAKEKGWMWRPAHPERKRRVAPNTRRGHLVEAMRNGGATMEQMTGIIAAEDALKQRTDAGDPAKRVHTILRALPLMNGVPLGQIGDRYYVLED